MKRVIVFLIVLIAITACSQNKSQENNEETKQTIDVPNIITGAVTAEQPETVKQAEKEIVEQRGQETQETNSLPKTSVKLEELQAFLTKKVPRDSIYSKDPFEVKLNGPNSFYVSESKTWGIYQVNRLSDQLKENTWIDTPSWEFLKYYDNSTKDKYPHLTEQQFNDMFTEDQPSSGNNEYINYYIHKYEYEDYLKDSTLISEDKYEEPIETTRGAVIRYRITQAIIDKDGKWTEKWEEPLLFYKISCTQDIVLFLKLESLFHRISTINLKPEEIADTWKKIADNDNKLLVFDEIMHFCGIIENKKFPASEPQEEHARYFANNNYVYYKTIINSTIHADIETNYTKNVSKIDEIKITLKLTATEKLGNSIRVHFFSNESDVLKSYNDRALRKTSDVNDTEIYETIFTDGLQDLEGEQITIILIPYYYQQKHQNQKSGQLDYLDEDPETYVIGQPYYLKVR